MARVYSVSYSGTLTNAGGDSDLLEVTPADDKPVRLRRFLIGQTSEVGDAMEEGVRISVMVLPATFTSGSGGSAITGRPPDAADAAAGFACEMNNTTIATTSGTAITHAELAWNERVSPCEYVWPEPDERPVVRQGDGLIIRMQTTLADDISGTVTVWLEEI